MKDLGATRWDFSDAFDPKELAYRDELEIKRLGLSSFGEIERWIRKGGFLGIIPYLRMKGVEFRGAIVELGAGSCWFTSELSKLDGVDHVRSVDFSTQRFSTIAARVMDHLNANRDKIELIVGDFHRLGLPDESQDMAVFDASLHHAVDIDGVLGECRRVLKKNGRVVAIRESFRGVLRNRPKSIEDEYGDFEHSYTVSEYKDFFRRNGFRLRLIPIFYDTYRHGIRVPAWVREFTPLRFLNGVLYASYVLVASKG